LSEIILKLFFKPRYCINFGLFEYIEYPFLIKKSINVSSEEFKVKISSFFITHSYGYFEVNILEIDGIVHGACTTVFLKNEELSFILSKFGVFEFLELSNIELIFSESITKRNTLDFNYVKNFTTL